MINLDAIIETVEGLLAQSSAQATTYAALECRLAIEKVCYERLKIAHDYIAHDDLRRWQPRDVVETLIAEVDGRIDSGFTLSISRLVRIQKFMHHAQLSIKGNSSSLVVGMKENRSIYILII